MAKWKWKTRHSGYNSGEWSKNRGWWTLFVMPATELQLDDLFTDTIDGYRWLVVKFDKADRGKTHTIITRGFSPDLVGRPRGGRGGVLGLPQEQHLMDTMVSVRRRKDQPLIEVRLSDPPAEDPDGEADAPWRPRVARDEDRDDPDLTLTRIIQAVAPPEDTFRGYTCVIGEIYDSDPRQKDRALMLLDEGTALDPDDFPPEDHERIGVSVKDMANPTWHSLKRAVIALKDLYDPDVIVSAADAWFLKSLRQTDGLSFYDPHQESHWPAWFPCMKTRREKGVIGDDTLEDRPPENRAFAEQIFMGLLSRDLFQWRTQTTPIFQSQRTIWTPVQRAIGLALVEFQMVDLTHQYRAMEKPDGYQMPTLDQEQAAVEAGMREREEELDARLAQLGHRSLDEEEENFDPPSGGSSFFPWKSTAR